MNPKEAYTPKAIAHGGFTLLELLVVIAVIALLAATLLPALAASRPGGREVVCQNNIRQMTLDEIIYTEDSGHGVPGKSPSGSTGAWFVNLKDYSGMPTNLLLCPTASQPQQPINNFCGNAFTPWCKTDYMVSGAPFFGGYTMNGWLFSDGKTGQGDGSTSQQYYYLKESSIDYPSLTPVLSDGMWVDCWPRENDSACHDLRGTISPTGSNPQEGNYNALHSIARVCIARHGCNPFAANAWTSATQVPFGTVNVGLFDGHVESSTLPNLWNYFWHNGWNVNVARPGTPY